MCYQVTPMPNNSKKLLVSFLYESSLALETTGHEPAMILVCTTHKPITLNCSTRNQFIIQLKMIFYAVLFFPSVRYVYSDILHIKPNSSGQLGIEPSSVG